MPGKKAAPKKQAARLVERRRQSDAFLAFARIQRLVDAHVGRLLSEEGLRDVTSQQANLLMVLVQAKHPMMARQLAGAMGLSEVTVGRFVKSLDAAGWVTRVPHPDDSRARLIAPTKRAYRRLPQFISVSNRLLDRAFEGFSEAEIRRISATTGRILQNLADSD